MKSWMAQLASHYHQIQRQYPQDRLMIIFDIDGTILDMRYMISHLLHSYDREKGTSHFSTLDLGEVAVHENHVERLLADLGIDLQEQIDILNWYLDYRWTREAMLESHRPYSGVLEVIRWFQIQPNTDVGLNTGRPDKLRAETLQSLNQLGAAYRAHFTDDLLHMNPGGWEEEVENAKVEGVRYFQQRGYRVFALVDNEPDNLKAIAEAEPHGEILLLHADTIFESKRSRLPKQAVQGNHYDITELISEKALPSKIQFVWHGVNDDVNLRQFLASEIHWGECDIRLDPVSGRLILRHDSFNVSPLQEDEEWLNLDTVLARLHKHEKRVKLDLKTGGNLIDQVLGLVERIGFAASDLWFNGTVEDLNEDGFRKLSQAHPGAILQCPVDFLVPLVCSAPQKAHEILDMFATWGINRFSVNWQIEDMRTLFDRMDRWGFEVNIYKVLDLEDFLAAVLMMPRSITSDFNFPKWHYYGRGSGEEGERYEYSMQKVNRNR